MDFTTDFWTKAYNRNISKLTGVCYRYVADRQLAEDLAHDAFMSAMEKSGSFKGTGQFDAWLRRITVNTALQHIRKQSASQLYENILTDDEMDNGNNLNIIAQADFSQEELLCAVNKLPEHHRLVFNMYVIDGYSHSQIAEELGISENTSKSHLARARKKLQEILTEEAQKKERKSAWLLLFLPFRKVSVDSLYSHSFSDFALSSATSATSITSATSATSATASSHAINLACATGHITVGSTATVATSIATTAVVAGGIGVGVAVSNSDESAEPVQEEHIVVVDSIATATDSIENADTIFLIDTTPIPVATEKTTFADTTSIVAPVANDTLTPNVDTLATQQDTLVPTDEKVVIKRKKVIRKRVVVVKDSAQ